LCQLHLWQMCPLLLCNGRQAALQSLLNNHLPALPACRDPIVLPFYHSGMGPVLPRHGRLPRAGHSVSVVVGQPIDLADLTCRSAGVHVCGVAWRGVAGLSAHTSSSAARNGS
jgi:hypothetical protein